MKENEWRKYPFPAYLISLVPSACSADCFLYASLLYYLKKKKNCNFSTEGHVNKMV